MSLTIIMLIMSLISYFGAKKTGASDAVALGAAAVAGIGTYYVGTKTEWGQSIFTPDKQVDQVPVKGPDGQPVLNNQGETVHAPPGTSVRVDDDGQILRDPVGNPLLHLTDTAAGILKEWGADGTSKVIMTGSAAGGIGDAVKKVEPNLLLIGGIGLAAVLLLRR